MIVGIMRRVDDRDWIARDPISPGRSAVHSRGTRTFPRNPTVWGPGADVVCPLLNVPTEGLALGSSKR